MPSTPSAIISSKNARTLFGIGAVEQRGVGGDAEAARHRFAHTIDRQVVAALLAHREIVMFLLAVHDGRRT